MLKILKLGLQQVDPALALFLHRFTSAEAKHSEKTLKNVKMIEPLFNRIL